jgi:hypothetical protein
MGDNFRGGDRIAGTSVAAESGGVAWVQHFLSVGSDGEPVDSAAMVTAIGSPDDAAWSGTGSGTVIAILKAIATNTAPVVP